MVPRVVRRPVPALWHLPGQRRADLQSGQSRNDFNCGAVVLYSWEVVQQTVAEDAKDGGVVTWETRGGASTRPASRLRPEGQAEVQACHLPVPPTGPRLPPGGGANAAPDAHLTRLPEPQ